MYKDYTVRITFDDGTNQYTFPFVQSVSDPIERNKDVIHEGNRGDGSIRIPGGKKSQTITINGILFDNEGYKDLDTLIAEMRSKVTTNNATLVMEYFDDSLSGGGDWVSSWEYTCFRNEEIKFSDSMRTESQNYTVSFLVLSY